MEKLPPDSHNIVLSQAADGKVTASVLFAKDNFWLPQKSMAELFGVKVPAIAKHLKNVYDTGEFTHEATISKMETVQIEGARRVIRDKREDVKLFVKLPPRFQIRTPIGNYNPDWAIVTHDNRVVYLVRETKGTRDLGKLRPDEAVKIRCGIRHFEALGVNFDVVTSADDLRLGPASTLP
ncbi:hypothetical protein OpiT1DRAFT_03383 [Opitutaceae bacterium TAV1]|nr:hypothetical protein OpiT1DRAFT_03383 [Opitutaceae bacterium TAV1]